METRTRTGIICHGRHLFAKNWKAHQFGNPRLGLGQIAKTCKIAHNEKPAMIIFGTGASEKDGVKEGAYTMNYMLNHFNELESFPQFKGINLNALGGSMALSSFPETDSKNSYEEITNAAGKFKEQGIERVILVSNPDHMPRCLQLAHKFNQKNNSPFEFIGAPSDICYDGTTTPSTVMIEAPHRGDDLSPNLAKSIGKYFELDMPDKKEFVKLVGDYLAGK